MTYEVIYADPPWSYDSSGTPAAKRPCLGKGDRPHSVNHYYDTLTIDEICDMAPSVAPDAVLFLWTTNPMLPDSFKVLDAWGFQYKTCITWQKLRCKGMGYWFRGHTEHLLLGVRGAVKAFRSLQPNIVSLPVHKHSEKPLFFIELIESVTQDSPRKLEMFGRRKREGWDIVGNQVAADLFDPACQRQRNE